MGELDQRTKAAWLDIPPKGLKGPTLYKAPTLPAWTWTGLYLGVNAG
jgi:hypothetical protein